MSDDTKPKIWTTKTYNRLSKYYDKFMRIFFPLGEKGRERIVERLEVGSILDVGCGTGTLLALATIKGLRCFGIDLSKGMLNRAKLKVPDAYLARASFYEIPFPSECFDYVVATNALSGTFIHAKDALVEMIRVCKHGGSVHIAEWPKAQKDTIGERLIVKLASLNDDAPKDYPKIFRELGLEYEVEPLD
jgi:ubiquinone/menaquinone biosynthesis C-methylase UbiE